MANSSAFRDKAGRHDANTRVCFHLWRLPAVVMRDLDFTCGYDVHVDSARCAVKKGNGIRATRRHQEPGPGTVGIIMIIVDPRKETRKRISFHAYAPVNCYLND
ncbi:hypothetical protein AWB80_04096 [Caballeronia pedi]|uniref:Uncharacterized protein n=1 Tax=Caballeronia pedi TaxID=1777141 RepID=A0A158BVX0_9BURK|nr:hypothetical protein AWB80_04096 [Caballeronia pedi]